MSVHSLHADRIRDHGPAFQPTDIYNRAIVANGELLHGIATGDTDLIIAGCRRLVAVGGLAKAVADTLERGRQ